MTHSWLLAVAYAAACALWWVLHRVLPLWPEKERPAFTHPWREVGIVLVAIVGVLGLGQLWTHGIRLPNQGAMKPVLESVNQLIIFAPVLAVPWVRRQGWASAWIRLDSLPAHVAVGIGLALFTLFLYATFERDAIPWIEAVRRIYTPAKAHLAVQVLLEDIAIAILFVRLAKVASPRVTVFCVAALFAVAHVPAMLAQGAPASAFLGLGRDFGLGVLVLGTLYRSADIAWFWPIHYTLDMTQYLNSSIS